MQAVISYENYKKMVDGITPQDITYHILHVKVGNKVIRATCVNHQIVFTFDPPVEINLFNHDFPTAVQVTELHGGT